MSAVTLTVTIHLDNRASASYREALAAAIQEAVDETDESSRYPHVLSVTMHTERTR